MKLSIITISLNNRFGLQKTIDSVISQTYQEFEWIVIDGGSTDGSKELIEQYAGSISYWVSEPDKGIYNAQNKGIQAANGEYLLMLNAGDYLYDKDVLIHVVPLLTDKDLYVGNEERSGLVWNPDIDEIGDLCELMTVCNIPPQSTFINKRVFATYGMYDEDKQILSDWWLFYNALILSKATIKKLPFTISVFDTTGISSTQIQLARAEKLNYLADMPRIKYITEFHCQNYHIVKALKSSRFIFFLFRIYYFFYRKRHHI